MQFATGTALMLMGIGLMVYAVQALSDSPYACAFVMLWLGMVEYAVGRAWWVDVCELRRSRA
jgi:hypothetical protein